MLERDRPKPELKAAPAVLCFRAQASTTVSTSQSSSEPSLEVERARIRRPRSPVTTGIRGAVEGSRAQVMEGG